MRDTEIGFSLVEALVYLALISLITAASVPAIVYWAGGVRVQLAAGEMTGVMHRARIFSAQRNAKVAVKFDVQSNGVVTHALYRDGDGDGVRNADIDTGVDPEVRPPRRLAHLGRRIRFGFPPGKPPRDPGNPRRRLDRLHDPIRFNRSDLASFNPRGTATPGTIYVTDGRRHLAAVRVNNRSGKISVIYYDPDAEVWR